MRSTTIKLLTLSIFVIGVKLQKTILNAFSLRHSLLKSSTIEPKLYSTKKYNSKENEHPKLNKIEIERRCAEASKNHAIEKERRTFLHKNIMTAMTLLSSCISLREAAEASEVKPTNTAEITDKIFITIKGIEANEPPKTIKIGLFGKDAPKSSSIVKQLISGQYKAPCKPRAIRVLEKEQLEATKVYNNCLSSQDVGVSYEGSAIWRIQKNFKIDVGAVVGKYLSRENPDFTEDISVLQHDAPGLISVRRGNEGGFGFSIFYHDDTISSKELDIAKNILNQEYIVIGRVLEDDNSLAVVNELNNLPIVKSSNVNYMALTGGATVTTQASRACGYGGPMYCNENKPLRKLQIIQCGLL